MYLIKASELVSEHGDIWKGSVLMHRRMFSSGSDEETGQCMADCITGAPIASTDTLIANLEMLPPKSLIGKLCNAISRR